MKSSLRHFWTWYQRHYAATLVVTTALFLFQGLHLYWLFTDVVLQRLTGHSYFAFPRAGLPLYVMIDYLEIPTHLSMTLLYIYELRRRVTVRGALLFLFLQIHWVHIVWITDDVVARDVTQHALFTWATGLAWIAILIDYLEVPIMLDQLHKVWQQRQVLLARLRANLGGRHPHPLPAATAAGGAA
jgi:hypothetical protein